MAIFRLKSMSGHDCECCVGFKLETLLWPLLVSAIWMSWYQVQEVHRGLQWLFVWGGTLQGGYSWRNLAPKQPSLCWYLSYFLVTLVIGIGAQNDSWGQATAGPTFEIISRVCFRAWFVVFKSFGRTPCRNKSSTEFSVWPLILWLEVQRGKKLVIFLNFLAFRGKSFTSYF